MDEPRQGPSYDWGEPPARRVPRVGGFDWLTLGAAAATFCLTVVLIFEFVSASLDKPAPPSGDDIAGYWLTAAIMIGIQVALLVRATRLSRSGLQVISTLALVIVLGVVVVFSVPPMIRKSEPPVYTTHPGYEPCYSGSGDCIGG